MLFSAKQYDVSEFVLRSITRSANRKQAQTKQERKAAEEEGEAVERRKNVVLSDEVMTMTELVQWIPTQQNESRSIAYSTLEFRAVGEGDTLVGYAAVST